ncbi:hypothetical protein O6H91_01G112900 [Diphasiastrum complanatum]|uniref:Uncharacterized protein n=1 Tax=Diphasiastrum complanatum TaxID=34168 RepID=A0ACC2EUU0_DIPCM|nr:hypothetical protein O6H91_01G112900 [Diphasiastrum complanatum]
MSTIWTPRLVYLTSIICGYGFLVQFAPIMPYYVPYLVQVKHLGIQQVTTQVLPVVSYSVLLFTILSAPACRLLSYRGVVIIGTFSVLASQVILLLARTLFWIQLSMVTI